MLTSRRAPTALVVFAILLNGRAMGNDLNHELSAKYSNKMFVLRNFYGGSHLTYDSTGQLLGDALRGDWTAEGIVEIDKLKLTRQGIEIHANRIVAHVENEKSFQLKRSGQSVKLDIQSGTDPLTAQKIETALSHLFLTTSDHFSELIPEFWKTCVELALAKVDSDKFPKCRFSNDVISLVGANPPSRALAEQRATLALGNAADDRNPVYRVGQGVSPPQLVHHKDPEFSEAARSAGIQGVLTLVVTVDSSGAPAAIQILQPIGAGLDAEAVSMVRTWKFDPAQKDGQPVAVRIEVEVEFHRQ